MRKQSFFGQPVLSPFADNGSLLINAADTMAGSADLISIRSRGTYSRPFTRVHEIQRQAEEGYRETADELAAQLKATEAKLTELQQLKTGEDKQVLSVEQEQAIDQFLAQKLSIRKSLREVQHQLTRDIEKLGISSQVDQYRPGTAAADPVGVAAGLGSAFAASLSLCCCWQALGFA